MNTYSHHYFTLLKECVLAKAGIKQLIPSECQKLSTLIFASTKKTVSETTLKRIYGFALSKFKPSPFTLQALAEYCGSAGWEAFCRQDNFTDKVSAEENTWQNMSLRANRTTQFTLQSLKKRSGIPYNFTIDRKFMTEHLNMFLQSNKTATFFAAQAGCGKTIGLCHLIENLLNENTSDTFDKNIILFFSSHTINSIGSDYLNLGDWLLSFLGFPSAKSLIDLFAENEEKKTKFYLIVDGFDEYMFKQDQYISFFNQLIDIVSFYSKYSWFKIILTMRSSTWLNYKYLIREQPLLSEKWFNGFMLDENKSTNVLPFDTDEILAISRNINPNLKSEFLPSAELIKNLSYPLFLQFYYQNNPDSFSIAETDHFSFYQVISAFAYHKIYQGKNSMEKVLLLKTLLEMIDYKSNTFAVPKILFCEHIRQYPVTYKELIANDIISEENCSKYLVYQEQISFANSTVFEYCLAKKFYHWNNSRLDENLITQVEHLIGKSTIKVPVIKWIIFFVINSNGYDQFGYLSHIQLESSQRLEVIIFTCQLLQKKLAEPENQEKLKSYFLQLEQSEAFNFFLSLQYSTPEYEKALHTLLKFNLSNKNKILIYTTLSLMSIFNLNSCQSNNYIEELNKFPDEDLDDFIVNPLVCLDTIYSYLKYGIIKTEGLQAITHLYYNDYQLKKMNPADYHYNEVILKLTLLTFRLNDHPLKELRFIKTALKHFHHVNIKENSSLNILYLGFQANAYLRAGNIKSALRTQSRFLEIQNSEYSFYTPFMKVFFSMLSVRNSLQNQAGKVALLQAKTLTAYCAKHGFNYVGVYTAIEYLKSLKTEDTDTADINEIYNYVLRNIRSSGFRLESFMDENLKNKLENIISNRSKVA
ncbi:MAG: hypothetical protein EOP43_01725 [Sphingobacteriaceae bacterium]|nr:MAG: hypothetical protein EOP43_01725 [Sphingobacteriaceae bacterium]